MNHPLQLDGAPLSSNLFEDQAIREHQNRHNDPLPTERRATYVHYSRQFWAETATTQERLALLDDLIVAWERDVNGSRDQAQANFADALRGMKFVRATTESALNGKFRMPRTESPNVIPISKLDTAKGFVASFNLEACKGLTESLADRVVAITGVPLGLDDCALEMAGYIGEECGCGECEDCLRSDALKAAREAAGRTA